MLSDIITALGFDSASTDQKFLVAVKDSASDLNFIYSELLSFYIKANYCIIMLNMGQSSNHFNHLLLKSGVNIRQLRDEQKFVVVDVLSEIEKITSLNVDSTAQDLVFSSVITGCQESECLKKFYSLIKRSIDSVLSIHESRKFVIFFDEISILLNLGVGLKPLEVLIQNCRYLCFNNAASNVLLIGFAYEEQDIENVKLANFLLHLADVKIQVEGLKTGYSKDAHGKILITLENKIECTSSHQKLLFKVTEKGAKLLTLGL